MIVSLANTPVLETEHLTLRAPVAADYPAWEAFAGSERARFVGGPIEPRQAWRAFGHVIGHWVLRGWGSFVFSAKGNDRPLGLAGPWYPQGWPEREIGWTVWDPAAEGKGLAFEAARRARAWAFADLGWQTAVSYIEAGNARSIALAERLGAVRDPGAPVMELDDPGDHDVRVYRHPAPEAAS